MSEQTVIDAVRAILARIDGAKEVSARAADGVVVLSGAVADAARRRLIVQEVLRLPQVLDVRDEIELPLAPGGHAEQLRGLLAAQGVTASGLEIGSESGVVTLRGEAGSWFDRDAAERLAWTLPGVRQVVNEIRIPAEAPDPEQAEQRP